MCKVFDHPVHGREAKARLLPLRQGGSPVAQYAITFRITAAECGWDDKALQATFQRSLNEELRDELAVCNESTSLEERDPGTACWKDYLWMQSAVTCAASR